MSRRAIAFTSVFLVCATAAAGVASCSPATVATTATCEPPGTPVLSIVSPAEGACLELSGAASDFIPVVVNAVDFQIRPPGSCNGCANCGHLILRVNDLDNNASTSSVVDVHFPPVSLPLSHYGTMKLTVELMDDCGKPWAPPSVDGGVLSCDVGPTGAAPSPPIRATVTVTAKPSCGAASSSSTGAASSSSTGAASTSSSGGTGGASSSSSGGTGGASSSSSGGTGGAGGADAGPGDAGDGG